jgi:chloramphenicol 3-O-phosphotransferase
MSQIVIVSGPSGAGKSSVCESLCERYDRTVHIETDDFFAAIRMGRINPMHHESGRQNVMVTRAAARAATAFAQELFAVFIDGVIGPHLLPVYLEELKPAGVPIQFVLLMPSLEATLARVAPRPSDRQMIEHEHRELHRQFTEHGPFAGCTVDNSGLTADQTADLVMEACGRGDCLVWSPES